MGSFSSTYLALVIYHWRFHFFQSLADCPSSQDVSGLMFAGFERITYLSSSFSPFRFWQARQRKGKVPNNPPEIDVDLPVRALHPILEIGLRTLRLAWF